jgi:D-tyrosyl-tRNA(Tyr) deacylase
MIGSIDQGMLVFLGVEPDDSPATVERMAHKLLHYRMFSDAAGKMNLNVQEIEGGILLISQFTLAADTEKGLRPSFSSAADPETAKLLYELLAAKLTKARARVSTGLFAADMQVSLVNDGPVTFLLTVN